MLCESKVGPHYNKDAFDTRVPVLFPMFVLSLHAEIGEKRFQIYFIMPRLEYTGAASCLFSVFEASHPYQLQ